VRRVDQRGSRHPLGPEIRTASGTAKIINILIRKSRLALEPADYAELQTKGLPFHLEIDVPPGDTYLRTSIYDLGSGNACTLGIPLTADHALPATTK
jgi:hypothetical protein